MTEHDDEGRHYDPDGPINYGDIVDALLMLDRDELRDELLTLVVNTSLGASEHALHRIATSKRDDIAVRQDAVRRISEQGRLLGSTMKRLRERVVQRRRLAAEAALEAADPDRVQRGGLPGR